MSQRRMIVALVGGLLAAGLVALVAVDRAIGFSDFEMGAHGWIALALAVVLTLALGIGLMALVFLSARRGYDDRAHHAEGPPITRDESGR
jgi:hypothetical protein